MTTGGSFLRRYIADNSDGSRGFSAMAIEKAIACARKGSQDKHSRIFEATVSRKAKGASSDGRDVADVNKEGYPLDVRIDTGEKEGFTATRRLRTASPNLS